jgi:chemotaxis methyl-accepting protein methylase
MNSHRRQPGDRFTDDVISLEADVSLSEREVSGVVDRIREHAGIDYHPGQGVSLRNALIQRVLQLDMSSAGDYLKLIQSDGGEEELAKLVSLIVVQKTSFFRDRPQFEFLERTVFPEIQLRKKAKDAPVNIWKPIFPGGC